MRNFFAFCCFFIAFFTGIGFLVMLPEFLGDILTLGKSIAGDESVPFSYSLGAICAAIFSLVITVVLFSIGLKLTKSAKTI